MNYFQQPIVVRLCYPEIRLFLSASSLLKDMIPIFLSKGDASIEKSVVTAFLPLYHAPEQTNTNSKSRMIEVDKFEI